MQISSTLGQLPGVEQVLIAMATGANLDLLSSLGFTEPGPAGPDDLLVALQATDDTAMAGALDRLESELVSSGGAKNDAARTREPARTSGAAVAALAGTGPSIVVVSTPGRYAFVEAMDALDAGASVLVFSDNVPVEQEVVLKRAAAERGLLVMGPDCGTAVIGGVGLGFANVVRPGPVGLVTASGTGAQQVLSLLAWAGVGISHCLGVGGRDLSEPVGALSTYAALDLLDADPGTELIVLVAKPAAPSLAPAVRAHVATLRTPVVWAVLDPAEADLHVHCGDSPGPARPPGAGLAALAGRRTGNAAVRSRPARSVRRRYVVRRGGGSLRRRLGPVVHKSRSWSTVERLIRSRTRAARPRRRRVQLGRPHPMIDPAPRLDRLAGPRRPTRPSARCCCSTSCSVTPPTPIRRPTSPRPSPRSGRPGPTSRSRQPRRYRRRPAGPATRKRPRLTAAGAACSPSNADAARFAVAAVVGGVGPRERSARGEPRVVTVGAQALADALTEQAVAHLPVDWRPPVPGTQDDLIRVLADPRRIAANAPRWTG